MWFFRQKDKNQLDNRSISDYLIGYTLNLMGKNRDEVLVFIKEIQHEEDITPSGLTVFKGILGNGCLLGISLEKNKVFKINIWLNNKPSKGDLENLYLFGMTHESEYYLYNLFDNSKEANKKPFNRYMIAFESKIF